MFDQFDRHQIIEPRDLDPYFRDAKLVLKSHPYSNEVQLLHNFDTILTIYQNTKPFIHTLPLCGEYEVTLGFGHARGNLDLSRNVLEGVVKSTLEHNTQQELKLPGLTLPTLFIFMQNMLTDEKAIAGVQFPEKMRACELKLPRGEAARFDKASFESYCQALLDVPKK